MTQHDWEFIGVLSGFLIIGVWVVLWVYLTTPPKKQNLANAVWFYFVYVMKHKWYVYKECRVLGLGFWQALKHDWTKLLLCEFIPYMNKFNRKLSGDTHQRAFDLAWLHHIHFNPHHWQHWILQNDLDGVKVLRMPEQYVKEMIADWRGVGLALGKGRENAVGWYLDNKNTLALHPQTRSRVETLLNIKIPDRYVQIVPPPIPREPGS